MVNSDATQVEKISLKYLEAGHTYLSADSFHSGVERSMSKRPEGKVLDFDDFVDTVQNSNGRRVKVVKMENDQFLQWVDGHSAHIVRKNKVYIDQMSIVEFRRGVEDSLFFKTKFDDEEFESYKFLKKNFQLHIPRSMRQQNRGIPMDRKQGIIKNLVPLLPPNRREFWINMECSSDDYGDDRMDDVFH
jgi:hypothetical protein